MTNQESKLPEKNQIEEKIRKLRSTMIQNLENGKFWELDQQAKQIQQSYLLMERI